MDLTHTTNGEGQDRGSKRSTKSLRVQERDLEDVALELALQGWNMVNPAQLALLSPSANTTEVAPEEIGNLGHTQCSDGSNPEVNLLDIIFFSPVWRVGERGQCLSNWPETWVQH